MDGRLDYIVGAYVFKEQADQQIDDVIFFNVLVPTIIDQESESKAVFVQGDFALSPTLGLTAGVRWTEDKKDLQGQIDTFFGSGIPSFVDRNDTWSVTTPRLGLEYEHSDNVFLYGSISKGYRTGGYNGLTVANPVSFNTPFDPETVWAYEFGGKTELLDQRLRLNTAVFFNQIEDIQQSSTLGGGATAIQNVGDVDVYGLEIELTALVSEGLEIFGHVTLQDESYQSLDPESVAAMRGQGRLSHLSKVQYQLGFNHVYSMNTGGTLLFGGTWNHRSQYFSDAENQPINDSGTINLLNAYIAYESSTGRWRTTLSGRNLADEEYSKIGLSLASPNGIRFVNEPPTWQLQFAMNGL
jgi:iron complex outermembrane receptor protein